MGGGSKYNRIAWGSFGDDRIILYPDYGGGYRCYECVNVFRSSLCKEKSQFCSSNIKKKKFSHNILSTALKQCGIMLKNIHIYITQYCLSPLDNWNGVNELKDIIFFL